MTDGMPDEPSPPVVSPWFVVAPVAALGWAWAALTFDAVTGPGGRAPWFNGWFCCGIVVGVPWLLFSWLPHIRGGSRWLRGVWVSVPVLAIVLWLLSGTDADLILRLRLSEAALAQEVEAHVADDRDLLPSERRGRRAGLFWVEGSSRYGGGVFLFTGRGAFLSDTGLLFLPPGVEVPPRSALSVRHLHGNWYRFVFSD